MKILMSVGCDATIVMLTGGFILALPLAIFSYFYSLKLFVVIQQKRRKKHLHDQSMASTKVVCSCA